VLLFTLIKKLPAHNLTSTSWWWAEGKKQQNLGINGKIVKGTLYVNRI